MNNVVKISEIAARELDLTKFAEEAERIKVAAQEVVVESEEQERKAVDSLVTIRKAYDRGEAARDRANEPHKARIEMINGAVKPITSLLKQAEDAIMQKLRLWREKKRELARIEVERRQKNFDNSVKEMRKAAGSDEELPIVKPPVTVLPPSNISAGKKGSVSGRMRWTFEIIAEEQVERAYCTPDSKKIRAAISAGVRVARGIRIFQTEDLGVHV